MKVLKVGHGYIRDISTLLSNGAEVQENLVMIAGLSCREYIIGSYGVIETSVDLCADLLVPESSLLHRSGRTGSYTASASLTETCVDEALECSVGLLDERDCVEITASDTDSTSITA